MQLERDLHAIAERVADPPERFEAALHLSRSDPDAAGLIGDLVEWPDLHGVEAHVQQASGERLWLVLEGPQILVLPGGRRPEELVAGDAAAASVQRAAARVVGADVLACSAAQRLIQRCAGSLAGQIPQGDVDGGRPSSLGADAAPTPVAIQRAPVARDVPSVLAEQIRRDGFMDVRGDRVGAEERLAQADETVGRLDLDEDQIREATCDERRDRTTGAAEPDNGIPWWRSQGSRSRVSRARLREIRYTTRSVWIPVDGDALGDPRRCC